MLVAALGTMLLLTHTRTEVIALMAGLLVAGLSMFMVSARVRKLFASLGITVSIAIIAFSSVLTTWLARGQNSQQLTGLTGRTTVWAAVVNTPRDWFQVLFGFGLSNEGFNGLPIDSNWLTAYQDLGLVGVSIVAAMLLFVLVNAYFQPRSERRALALFLVAYLMVTSYTETGLSNASMYLLELALAASLLVPPAADRSLAMRILLVHNQYRSGTPSGENRVVDQEGEALARAGHEVRRFGRSSDEIEDWSTAKKASLPARVVWSPATRRDLTATLAGVPTRRRPCAQHVSPAQCLRPVRLPGRGGSGRGHHPQLPAGVRQRRPFPSRRRLSRLPAPPSRCRGSCTVATGDHARPPRRWWWPMSRTGRRGGRWSRPTCSSPRLSATCTVDSACLRTGFSSGTT